MHRSAKWAVAGVAALAIGAAALEACSTKKPNGGLVVSIATDGKIPIETLKVTIRQVDARGAGTVNEVVRSCKVSDCALPTTVGVISNGDPTASVIVTAIATDKSGVVLDTRTHTVTSVPVDRTANLVIVLSASCAAQASADGTSKCGEGMTCDPATGGCTSATKSAAALPEYVPGSEYDVGVPEVSTADSGSSDTATDTGGDSGCPTSQKLCGGACVPNDAEHGCSAPSCDACPSSNGSAFCDGSGSCVLTCNASFKKCGGKCVSVDDPNYGCGVATCDKTPCPDPGAGTLICSAGACVIGTCGVGTKKCGSVCVTTDVTNGCEDTTKCTPCGAKQDCQGSPSVCTCVSDAKTTTCAGKCGVLADNCGKSVDCGTSLCVSPETCGGGGTLNVCGCTGEALTTTCSGGKCGTQTNNCKKSVTCPTTACTAPQSCGGGGTPNLCGGCDWTSTYPAAAGCPSANHAWQCWTPPAIGNRTADFNVLTLCGDSVIKDTKTGLMWAQNEEPAANWATAKTQCTSSRRGGFADWRLPTPIELQSIVDYLKAAAPTIDSKFQGQTVGSTPTSDRMWSSSAAALSSGNAWYVSFSYGNVSNNGATSSTSGVRCVR